MSTPLLRTKLFIPLPQPNQLDRPELIQRLDMGLKNGCCLLLVSAPAGSGKTSLLSSWLASLQARQFAHCAWLALEESDNDPVRFWSYCIAALQTIAPEAGKNSLELLHAAQPAASEAYLTLLINDLAESQTELVLVLDDFQLIQNLSIQQGLVFWINHLPVQIHLVLSSRADPLLPLARLRARRQVLELRYQDLRFSNSEAASLLQETLKLPLSGDEIKILADRTEGWAAGLQIAALSLKNQKDPAVYIRAYSSLDRNLVDYFSEEILSNLPAEIQAFLLKTALLDRFSAELCQAVNQNQNSRMLLEQLERENLFIVPLDNNRQWYRFHTLFSDLLRHRLSRSIPQVEQCELHRRASRWFESNGLEEDALLQALAGQDFDRAGALLQRLGIRHILDGQSITVLSWCKRFPSDWLAERPDLYLIAAWALLASALFKEAESCTQIIEKALSASASGDTALLRDLQGQLAAIRATAAFGLNDPKTAMRLSLQALDLLSPTNQIIRCIVSLDLADACWMSELPDEARLHYQEAYQSASDSQNWLIAINALCMTANIQAWQGQLHQSAGTYHQALRISEETGLGSLPTIGLAEDGLSMLHLEWDEPEAALKYAQSSLTRFKLWGHSDHIINARLAIARCQRVIGDLQGAQQNLDAARELAQKERSVQQLARIEASSAHISLLTGDKTAALHSLKIAGLVLDGVSTNESYRLPDAIPALLVNQYPSAVLFLRSEGQYDLALQMLDMYLQQAGRSNYQWTVLRTWLIQSIIFQSLGRREAALDKFDQVIRLAEPQGYLRTFLNEGQELPPLLQGWLAQHPDQDPVRRYAALLLEKIIPNTIPAQPVLQHSTAAVLSEREVEVLRLAAAGLSNEEIAAALIVSTNTIKTHLKRIFEKLAVKNRQEAANEAHRLKLL